MKQSDLHWLAGLLEGEGTFVAGPPSAPNQPRISVEMTDRDIIERVAALCSRKYIQLINRKAEWKPTFALRFNGSRAVALMRELQPLMGKRRQAQIDKALANYVERPWSLPRRVKPEAKFEIENTVRRTGELAKKHGIGRHTVMRIRREARARKMIG